MELPLNTSTDDNLQNFLRVAEQTFEEALKELREPLRLLTEVDSLYVAFLRQGGGIKPATSSILLLNAHASFRAAIRLAFSGQLLPVFMTLRGSIESALYANGMVVEPRLTDVWLHRDESDKARQECRDEFTVGKMFRAVVQAQDKEFADRLREMYDATIDFGAHPNNRSLLASTRIEGVSTGEAALNFAYFFRSSSVARGVRRNRARRVFPKSDLLFKSPRTRSSQHSCTRFAGTDSRAPPTSWT
jgi:hypothetical protein